MSLVWTGKRRAEQVAKIGVQTKNVIKDENPLEGFEMLKRAGFTDVDFSLNGYLLNTDLYHNSPNKFFDQSMPQLEAYFTPHKCAAEAVGIAVSQMHMPYPIYVPTGTRELNAYLSEEVAPKSMQLCSFFGCRYIVVHGFKLVRFLGSEEAEWERTAEFLDTLAPMAKELGITVCMENLYDGVGGHMVEGPGCDVQKAIERIDWFNEKYGAEVLGFCFDTGHANLVGLDFEAFITKLGNRLKVFHIHDNDGISDLHQIPFTFAKTRENTSSTDWPGFIRGLRNIRFSGALSFETAPVLTAFPDCMKQDALWFIARIGKYFAEEADRGMESLA